MTTTITISVTAFAKQCWLHAPQTTGGLFENLCDKLLLERMQPQNSSFENKVAYLFGLIAARRSNCCQSIYMQQWV